MRKLRVFASVVCALALSDWAGSALAQTRLDAPTLRVVDGGFYRIDLELQAGPSGAPGGFAIEWMTAEDYVALEGWPADEYNPAVQYCHFTGVPTLNVDSDAPSFILGPDAAISLQIGDLFDETGASATYVDGLQSGKRYVFRAHAEGTTEAKESDYSATVTGSTPRAECTQGFWKNHPEVWPSSCLPMLLGTVPYTQAELLAIYNEPAAGNGLIFLAHQLITAKLNGCNGSDLTPVAQTIADADALIDGLVVPPIGGGFLAPSAASGLTETLDRYNNGLLGGVVNCPTPVRATTWGKMKAQYR